MTLYYLYLGLDYHTYCKNENDFRYQFQKHTCFISNYMSKVIRKYRFKTDGTFNMISVALTEYGVKETSIIPIEVLKVFLPFDRNRYEAIKGTSEFEYYLELLEAGYRKAAEFKEIPLEILLNLIEEFRANGCTNEWLIRKRKFKNFDLEIILTGHFTTNDLHFDMSIKQISTKQVLAQGTIYSTNADENSYGGYFKDIIIDDDIFLIDEFKTSALKINFKDIFESKLTVEILNENLKN